MLPWHFHDVVAPQRVAEIVVEGTAGTRQISWLKMGGIISEIFGFARKFEAEGWVPSFDMDVTGTLQLDLSFIARFKRTDTPSTGAIAKTGAISSIGGVERS